MAGSIRGTDFVQVHVPDSATPPTRMQLVVVRAVLQSGRLPPSAMVQAEGAAWRPVREVLSECKDFEPTRSWPVVFVVAVLPVVLAMSHALVFGAAGVGALVLLVLFGVAAAVMVGAVNAFRTRAPGQLVVTIAALAAVVVVAEVFALREGFGARSARARIEAAATGPLCAAETLDPTELTEYGTDEQKQTLRGKDSECATQHANERCGRIGKALASGLPVPDVDLRDLGPAVVNADADAARALTARITGGQVGAADLRFGTRVACNAELVDALARKLATTPAAWSEAPVTIAPQIFDALKKTPLSPESKAALHATAEGAAKPVQSKTALADLGQAHATCDVAVSLGAETGANCEAVQKKYRAASERAAKAQAANAEAQAASAEADDKKQTSGFLSCMRNCNVGRSAGQAQDDNAAAADCSHQCGNDATCLMKCSARTPKSNGGCQARCLAQFPSAAQGF